MLFQRVSELEAELASKSQSIGSLSSELAELKQKSVNIDDLEHTVRDLQRQLDLARDASDVTQQKNAELRQSLKNKDNQLEVNKIKLIIENTIDIYYYFWNPCTYM